MAESLRLTKRYKNESLLESSEINLDIINSKEKKPDFLKKKVYRQEKKVEKISQEELDFNLLKYNLSSQTNSMINVNLSKDNENLYGNNYFPNEASSFFNNYINEGAKAAQNKEFENNFLKQFIFSKVEKILTGENLKEKLNLYYIISSSDLNSFKAKTENLFTKDNRGDNSDMLQEIEKKVQREFLKRTIWSFCNYIDDKGYSIVPLDSIKSEDNVEEEKDESVKITVKSKIKKERVRKDVEDMKKAWLCPHIYRVHYARGKCQNCYLNFYHKVIKIF